MKDKALYLASITIAFIFGSLGTYLYMTKQQMDHILQAKQSTPLSSDSINSNTNNQDDAINSTESLVNQTGINELPTTSNNINAADSASLNDYSQQQAMDIVNNMPDYALGQYVDRFMAKGASDVIADKRRFAERAVEELYKSNDSQPLSGTIKLSLSPTMPAISLDTSTLSKNTKLFAHLDTNGKVPASAFVFVKWVNNQTGQVLLFEKKDIIANSNQNWVSFTPYDGWTEGSYDIRFYQFTSELEPVAQLTYQIYNVADTSPDANEGITSGTVTVATAAVKN